jgi:hypothetical protein
MSSLSINVRRLVCNVSVKSKEKKSPLHKDPKAKKPDLQFREAAPQSGQAPPVGSETATEDKGPAAGRAPVSAAGADPRRVAEKVYDLMKEEVRLGRLRGG